MPAENPVYYYLLNNSGSAVTRNPLFCNVLQSMDPDVVMVQGMTGAAGVTHLRLRVPVRRSEDCTTTVH